MPKWPNGILFDIQHFDIVELTNKHIYWIETRIVTSYRQQLQKLI